MGSNGVGELLDFTPVIMSDIKSVIIIIIRDMWVLILIQKIKLHLFK